MTMKIIILVVINLVATISSEFSDIRMARSKFESIYREKCLKNLDLTQQKEFKIAFNEYKCLDITMPSSPEAKDSCSNYASQFVSCLQNFAKVAKGCLDTNEKYLPDFIINAEKRILERFCKGNGIDHLTKIAYGKCSLPLSKASILPTCLLKLNIIKNLDMKDYSLNRIDVCSDLKTLQKCLMKLLATYCEIAKEDIDFFNSVFEEYQKECSLANTNMSNFVLLATIVIIFKLSQCFYI